MDLNIDALKSECREMCLRLYDKLKKVRDFYNVPLNELLFVVMMFLVMLFINYLLIALHGFSLSYSKQFPGISCLSEVFWLLWLLVIGHFACRRCRWYLFTLTTLQFAVLFVLLAIYFTTGTFFCESVLYLVYDTTWEESKGFVSAYVDWKSILILIGILAAYSGTIFFIMKLGRGKKKYCKGDLAAIGTLLLIFFIPWMLWQGNSTFPEAVWYQHPFHGIYDHIRTFNNHAGAFIVEMRHRSVPDYVELNPAFAEKPPIGVLVIGESAIRSHHSIYGYGRNTTPSLLARKDEIIAFDDTIAVLPMTITALKYWLTDMTLEHRHLSWTIFDVLKKSGYKVDVITNQNKSGWADSPLQMIFATADTVTYMHEENFSDLAEDRNAQIYDGALLPPFSAWIGKAQQDLQTPQLVVLHLFGSHEPYGSRFPAEYSHVFMNDTTRTQRVNEYDSSVWYSDLILGKILAELEKLDRPAYLIYFSDHGSVCEQSRLRTPGSVENSAYEIPFLIWTNRHYRERVPELVERMKRSRQVPLQADRAHFGLLEMMGITFRKDVEAQNFLSDKYVLPPRFVREGEEPYLPEQ